MVSNKEFIKKLITFHPLVSDVGGGASGDLTTVSSPLILDGYNISLLPANSTQDGYLTRQDYIRFDARANGFRTWQYEDFTGPVTTPITLTAFENGSGLAFDSSLIVDSSAIVVLSSNNEKPPTTTTTIPGRWLSSNRVSVASHTGTTVTLNQNPAASLGIRVFFVISIPAGTSFPDNYEEAPKFVRERRIAFLDEAFVNQEGNETIYDTKTFADNVIVDGYFQYTNNPIDGYVLTSNATGVTSWQPGAGAAVSDHGLLTGLLDDDHPQYFNNTRLEPLLDGYTTDAEFTSHTGDATIHFTEASIDHGSITGLGDDDHTQYYNNTRLETILDGYTTDAEFTTHTGNATIHFAEASIDHGSITGLGDDDHPQYYNNTRLEAVLDGYTTDTEFSTHTGDATIHFTENSIDHGTIAGLADDDHLQYYNSARLEPLLDGYTTDAEFTTHTGDATIHFAEASIDHGSIVGLGDDDHSQYFNILRLSPILDGYIEIGDTAGGDLSGTYPNPSVAALTETGGPTSLPIGSIPDGYFLRRSGASVIGAQLTGGGDVSGPGSSTNNAVVRWDGTAGNTVQNSSVIIDDFNNISTPGNLDIDGYINGHSHYPAAAIDPTSPTPKKGDRYYNTTLEMEMRYDGSRAKFLSTEGNAWQAGRTGNIAAGSFYRTVDGLTMSATIGYPAYFNGTIVSFGYTRSDNDSATFQITANGTTIASLASSAPSGISTVLNANFTAGQILGLRNASGGNTTSNVAAWIRIKWRA